jgi:hypothetical protein
MDVVGDAQGVIGVAVGDEARAYPLKLMNYHEVINDALGGAPILVTWSALADAGIAMLRTRPDGKVGLFGSAGLIYQSAIMMYDLDTMSLWSSTEHRCVAGDSCGIGLEPVQATITNWQAWKSRHPNTTVLVGTNPVLPLNYEANPAVPRDYLNDPRILYPVYGLDVARTPVRLKSLVFGVAGPDGKSVRAYDVGLLIQSSGPFEDALGGLKVTCEYTREGNIFSVKSADGKPLLTEMMFWMAWAGAHPNTEVWQEGKLRAAMNPAPSVPMAPTAPSAAGPAVTPAGTLK